MHLTRNAADLVRRRDDLEPVVASRTHSGLRPRFAAVAELLTSAEPDLLAHFAFPEVHRRQIRSA